MKRLLGLAFLVCGLCLFARLSHAEFYGDPALGLVDFQNDRYGASFYVPENYDAKLDWPLVVVLYSDEAEKGKFFVDKWLAEAKKRKVIALFISYLNPQEMPFGSDERTLGLIHEIKRRYSIVNDNILLTAFGEAAHYAYYLAFRYPSEFHAVGLIGGGAEGRYEPFLNSGHSRVKNVLFLILYGKQDVTINQVSFVETHRKLKALGHNIEMEEFENLDHKAYPEEISKIMDWYGGLSAAAASQEPRSGARAGYGTMNVISNFIRGVFKS